MIDVNSQGIPISEAFAEAVAQPIVSYDAKLFAAGVELECTVRRIAVSLGSSAAGDGVSEGFSIGGTYSARVEMQLSDCGTALTGVELEVRIGVELDGGLHEYVTVALATVTSARRTADSISVVAQGRIAARMSGQADLGGLSGDVLPDDLADAISEGCGVDVSIGPFATVDTTVHVLENWTYRDALSALAGALGGFAAESGSGVLVSPFPESAAYSPDPEVMTSLPQLDEADYEVDGLTVAVPASGAVDPETGEPDEAVFYTFGTGRVVVTDPYATRETAEALWENIRGYTYRAGTFKVAVLDPRVTPFDMARVMDADGVMADVPCTGVQAVYDGGYFGTVTASAMSEAAEQAAEVGPVSKAVDQAALSAARAQASASQARDDAVTARNAAESAVADATEAKAQARSATASAAEAGRQAASAIDSASAAGIEASNASKFAGAALDQLGVVQDVVGVLSWASEHGSFEPTRDTSVVEGKVYFVFNAQSGDYEPVIDPQEAALATYYELTVDEAMNSYIMAHFAVTTRGLWVLPGGLPATDQAVDPGQDAASASDTAAQRQANANARKASDYKMLLSNDGAYIYDGSGVYVTKLGENIEFNSTRSQHIGSEDAYIIFTPAHVEDSRPVAASLVIGGSNVQLGSSKTLSEWEADMQQAIDDSAAAVQTANDVPIVTLSSTNGTVFKRNLGVSTTIVATIFTPGGRIDNATELRRRYGAGAYLEWGWRDVVTDAAHVLVNTDPRIGNGGFTLTVDPDDIDVQAVITCSLNY